MEEDMMNMTLSLFKDKSDVQKLQDIIETDIGKLPIGMSEFQITNFVLNNKEFCNPLFKYQQSKTELFVRIQGFVDSYYQMREAKAHIILAEGRIEELKSKTDLNKKVRDAKIELQNIEIEKNNYKLHSIEKQAKEKLREAIVFHNTFDKYKYLEDLPQEELNKMEEEGWQIKSMYYPELQERYGLTVQGQIEYPHENGGLKGLLQVLDNNNGRLQLKLKDDNKIEV
jgi:hypothetical protein